MVSVCMATYNGAKYISQQLTSIIHQLGSLDEIIVSDDGSTDDTLEIVRAFQDNRIKVHEVNFKSVAKNFEHAISKATGDYIFFSDQDDIWMDNKVAVCTALLQQYDVVVSNCNIIDENGKEIMPSLFKEIHSGSGLIKNLLSNTYYGCCMCFTRKIITVVCPFPKYTPMHDVWIGFTTDLFFKAHFEEQVLVSYRRHERNVTFITKSTAPLSLKIKRRINLIRYYPLLLWRRLILKSK